MKEIATEKSMKRGSKLALFLILIPFLGSGCMMMHKDMHGEENHGSHSEEKASVENKSETTGEAPQRESHKERSKSKKTSKTLVILGGIGMGLMMVLMFL